LSGMQGNLHVPFLGGWAGAIPPGYPAMGKRTVRQRALCLPSAKYHRLTRRPSKGQKDLQERAIMTSQRPFEPW